MIARVNPIPVWLPPARHAGKAWRVALLCLFLAAGLALVWGVVRVCTREIAGLRDGGAQLIGTYWPVLLGAATLYLASHALRAARLSLILHDERQSLRDIFATHTLTSAASLLVPFKLGELYRVAEIARLVGSPVRAALLVWTERVLDVLAITAMLLLVVAAHPELFQRFAGPIALVLLIGLGTLVAFTVLPENLESLKLFVIRRYDSPASLRVLAGLDAAGKVLTQAPHALRRRKWTLFVMTIVIWLFEVGAMSLFAPKAAPLASCASASLAFLFSTLVPGGSGTPSFVQSVQAVAPGTVFTADQAAVSGLYPWAVYVPFMAVGVAAFFATLRPRLARAFASPNENARAKEHP